MMTCIGVIHSILARKNTNNITKMTPQTVYTHSLYTANITLLWQYFEWYTLYDDMCVN